MDGSPDNYYTFIPDLIYLVYSIVFHIYPCTGWTYLPKRNCFISFFNNIFKAIAESPIAGPMISCMNIDSQVGYKCQFSWDILKWKFVMKNELLIFLSNSYPFK